MLQRISSKKKLNNTYIDIGGFDPIKFSNTYKLYQKNWSGLIIEPNKDKAKNWKKIRPRDHIVNSAVVEKNYKEKKAETMKLYTECSKLANDLGLMVNAGHDLNLENIKYFSQNMPFLNEVSIGHALISESIYLGIENVINLYINKLS